MRCIPTTHEAVKQLLEENTSLKPHGSNVRHQGVKYIFSTLANSLEELLRPHLANGDRISKVQCCRAYYTVILFSSGTLVLFSPLIPALHGSILSDEADPVVDVATGDYHIVFCTNSGAVYSCGYSNRYGQLGDGTIWDNISDSKKFSVFNEQCGGCSTPPLLSTPRRVLGFDNPILSLKNLTDSDSKEQLDPMRGLEKGECDTSSGISSTPLAVDRPSVRICAVSCGAEHTLLLSASLNGVYSCGRGHCGQLGLRQCAIPLQLVFRLIPLCFGLPIRQIFATGHHSFFLTSTGRLFGFGENQAGQLGIGTTSNAFIPTPVKFLSSHCDKAVFKGGMEGAAEESIPLTDKTPLKGNACPVLDSRAYTALHAPYDSLESIYYPFHIKRLGVDLEPEEPFIEAVWGCPTTTIALTKQLDWLSCGLAISRSWASQRSVGDVNYKGYHHGLHEPRYDGHGALGRPLLHIEEAWRFGHMTWGANLKRAMCLLSGTNAENTTTPAAKPVEASVRKGSLLISQAGVNISVECVIYSHVSFVKLERKPVASNKTNEDAVSDMRKAKSFIFIESNVCEATFEGALPMNIGKETKTNLDFKMPADNYNFLATPLSMSTHLVLNEKEDGIENEVIVASARSNTSENTMLIPLFEESSDIVSLKEFIIMM
ncbi:unnamed protein product [Phytomonas sp. EM1]|nr:unnamed protein product [Phytomonas sp. EM1]|eukprot:CCW60120.1 unnamed protein product [Phytomonas sp. isolate EM1]